MRCKSNNRTKSPWGLPYLPIQVCVIAHLDRFVPRFTATSMQLFDSLHKCNEFRFLHVPIWSRARLRSLARAHRDQLNWFLCFSIPLLSLCFISFFFTYFHVHLSQTGGDAHISLETRSDTIKHAKWKCYFVDFLCRLQIAFKIGLAAVAGDRRSTSRAFRIDKCVHEFNEKKANGLNACDMWFTLRECHHTPSHNHCGYLIFKSQTNRLNSPIEIFQFRINSIATMNGLAIPWLVALHDTQFQEVLYKFCMNAKCNWFWLLSIGDRAKLFNGINYTNTHDSHVIIGKNSIDRILCELIDMQFQNKLTLKIIACLRYVSSRQKWDEINDFVWCHQSFKKYKI